MSVHGARRGDYVVASVRRPGSSIYDPIGLQDMTTDDVYFERGINLRHGYLAEYYVDDPEYSSGSPPDSRRRRPARANHGGREGHRPGLRDPAAASGLAAAKGGGDGRRHNRTAGGDGPASPGPRRDRLRPYRQAEPQLRPDRGARRPLPIRRPFDSGWRQEVRTVRSHLRGDRRLAGRLREHAGSGQERRLVLSSVTGGDGG